MKRTLTLIAFVYAMISSLTVSAQALSAMNHAQTGFTNFVTSSFINYYTRCGMPEKLYLVTDKPYYSAGDTIYFSAFLVNSMKYITPAITLPAYCFLL